VGADVLRGITRVIVGLFALVIIAVGSLAWTTLEFGDRPAFSLQPLPIASDIKFIEANGIRFAYVEAGQGPLVLLFHGYPETARSWGVVQQRLAASGYRVIAPFMRGYPPTALAANGDYSVPALARDVLGLIDAFGAQSAIVVGHDWGASAVYAAAVENPAKISRMVAIAIPHPGASPAIRRFSSTLRIFFTTNCRSQSASSGVTTSRISIGSTINGRLTLTRPTAT
jgi:pimeloyl-ACP methyl ester carboxylesterase